MFCVVNNCNISVFTKGMCYNHHIFRYKITTYYHKIGDKILNEKFKNLPNEKELINYNKKDLNKLIHDLYDNISKLKKCLYARKEMERLYCSNDNGHALFIENIINNIKFIENYLSKCYTFLINKDNHLLDIINKNNDNKSYQEIKNLKKKKKKSKNKIKVPDFEYLKNNDLDYTYLNNIKNPEKYDLNNSLKIKNIINEIFRLNFMFKNLFTETIENDIILILNNSSYCIFIKDIFNKCGSKYVKLNYNNKNKEIYFQLNYLLDENDYKHEISKLNKFHDEIKIWIKKIIKIILDIKYNCYMLYNCFIKYEDKNNKNNDCECKECKCYFKNIDLFIQKYYDILCIHIENGFVKNICLEKRHKRVLKKELLNIEDIFNKIDIINNSLIIPNDFNESLCFWILNNLAYDNNIKIYILKGHITSCIKNNIFMLCSCIDLYNNNHELLINILIYGCNIYLLKNKYNSKNHINDILEKINFEDNKQISFYLCNKNFKFESNFYETENILLHNKCEKNND